MSATVMYYPQNYTTLIPLLKNRIAKSNPGYASNINIGVSTNFDKLCGCVLQARLGRSRRSRRVLRVSAVISSLKVY